MHHSAINLCAALTQTFHVTLQLLPEINLSGSLAPLCSVSRMGSSTTSCTYTGQPLDGRRASPKTAAPSHTNPGLGSTMPWSIPHTQHQPLGTVTPMPCIVQGCAVKPQKQLKRDSALKINYFLELKIVTVTDLDVRQQIHKFLLVNCVILTGYHSGGKPSMIYFLNNEV